MNSILRKKETASPKPEKVKVASSRGLTVRGPLGIVFCLGVLLTLVSCDAIGEFPRQMDAANALRRLAAEIEVLRSSGVEQNAQTIETLARELDLDKDPWGSSLEARVRRGGDSFSYLLVYYGKDQQADVTDVGKYFDLTPVDISGMAEHDIVIQDGRFLTYVSLQTRRAKDIPHRPLLIEESSAE